MLEAALRHDRVVVAVALSVVVTLSWIWIAYGSGLDLNAIDMTSMPSSMAMEPPAWSVAYAAVVFIMWWVMMVGMMLPSAAPVLLLFARMSWVERINGRPWVPTGAFVVGYLVVWGGFSVAATTLQFGLDRSGLISGMMVTTTNWFSAMLLIAAGLWQITPIKRACLRQCRSPVSFLARHWIPGWFGAFRMGLVHGAFCVGCCWFLMGLLFFGGVMNLWWISGIAIYVLLEKMSPVGNWLSYPVGLCLTAWGILAPGGLGLDPHYPRRIGWSLSFVVVCIL